jgi:hypothetical protein
MAAAILGALHWLARPHLVSQLFVVLLLDRLEREEPPPWWHFTLGFALWANLHGGWIYGLVLVAIYLTAALAERRWRPELAVPLARVRQLLLGLGAGLIGILLTPYGAGIPLHVLAFFTDDVIKNNTNEFLSPDFHELGQAFFLLAVLACLAGVARSPRPMRLSRLGVLAANLAFALFARRNIAIFALTALPVTALHLDPEWRTWPEPPGFRAAFGRAAAVGRTLPLVLVTVAVLLLLAAADGRVLGRQLIPNRFSPSVFPVAAVERARKERLDGPLFHNFVWGGYLLYAWPEQKVFIDGGTDFYGGRHLREFIDIYTLQPGWRGRLDHWGIRLAILPARDVIAHELVREPDWRVWSCDSTAVVLRRAPADSTPPAVRAEALRRCAGLPLPPPA